MVDEIQRVTEVESSTEAPVANQRVVETRTATTEPGASLAARVIWYIAGVLLALLAIRFLLVLLGANPNNGFADFIYSVSHPFVAPFFGLFGYNLRYGVSRVESFTLVAMAIYALIAWGLARLVTLRQPRT